MTRRLLLTLAVVAAVLLPGAPAWAHNQLSSASPAAGSTVAASPSTVTLRFLETLKPDFTTIVVSDSARAKVPSSAPALRGNTGVVTLTSPLANGVYTVAYRTVSVDGHSVQGSYTFIVDDPAKPAALVAAAPASAGGDGGVPFGVLIGVGAAGVLLAAAAVAFGLRRRR
ncbi:hypothetical protein Ade02nite_09960 [Paractinoplanes deccanensis]|uniref:CopC domain-containing protein n=1 Tax=Paractinoplanes deccanensis TaxID=113561 RepID=A0ABQ3XX81_9ACTN|nr:copper resistance CopC family protein [Actinoplanes deccanensis]GID72355.1 hypothetical protein Ade02nite_09960 [Actinoplanes deccanensis]